MKLLFVWLLGYYCVDVTCYQLHKPMLDIYACELEVNQLTLDFADIDNEYNGKWELECYVMTNKYVGLI